MRKLVLAIGLVSAVLGAAHAVSQEMDVLLATGPGVAGAAERVHLSGTIAALDAKTRLVTLKGEGGGEMVVTAGPEVKNFDKLAVGDKVDLYIARALQLELRKGSTAQVSRTDDADRVDSGEEGRPGGAIGHRVVVMAEVTALDAETQTVTLRGPKHSMDLELADPEQFKAIAVGDRVEATYVEAVAVQLTPAAKAE